MNAEDFALLAESLEQAVAIKRNRHKSVVFNESFPAQVKVLKALDTLGYKWVTMDEDGDVIAWKKMPDKDESEGYWENKLCCFHKMGNDKTLDNLLSWSDMYPLHIKSAISGVKF